MAKSKKRPYKKTASRLPPVVERGEVKVKFLGYHGLLRKYFMYRYDLNSEEYDRLCWIHMVGTFTKDDFEHYTAPFSWNRHAIKKFLDQGWIVLHRKGISRHGEQDLYKMTTMASVRFGKHYKYLTGIEPIPDYAKNRNRKWAKAVDFTNKTSRRDLNQ